MWHGNHAGGWWFIAFLFTNKLWFWNWGKSQIGLGINWRGVSIFGG